MPKSVSCPSCGAPVPIGTGHTGRCTFCGSTVYLSPGEIPPGIPSRPVEAEIEEIRQMVRSGNRLHAIRQLHTRYDIGLKTAKDTVDLIADGEKVDIGTWPLRGTAAPGSGAVSKNNAAGCLTAGAAAAILGAALTAYLLAT